MAGVREGCKDCGFLYLASCEARSQRQRKHCTLGRTRHAGTGASVPGSHSLASCMKLEISMGGFQVCLPFFSLSLPSGSVMQGSPHFTIQAGEEGPGMG